MSLTTRDNYGPFDAALKAIRKDAELVAGLNAVQKRLLRPMSDIVLRMCAEHYFPGGFLVRSVGGRLPDGARDAMLAHLRELRFRECLPISKAVVVACREWIIKNVSRVDVNGRAVWYDDEERIAQRAPDPFATPVDA